MLAELFPRSYERYTRLRLLGPHVEGLVAWLQAEGYPLLPIRRRLCVLVRLERRLGRRRVRELGDLSTAELLDLAPRDSQDDIYLSALVHSLARHLDMCGVLAGAETKPSDKVVGAYGAYLERVRGLAESTLRQHCTTAGEFLGFLDFDHDPERVVGKRSREKISLPRARQGLASEF